MISYGDVHLDRLLRRKPGLRIVRIDNGRGAAAANHFNQERHLVSREIYKQTRSAAPIEWRAVMA